MKRILIWIATTTVATAQILRLTNWVAEPNYNLEAELLCTWMGKTYAAEVQSRVAARGGFPLHIVPMVFRVDVRAQAHTPLWSGHILAVYGAHTSLHTLDNWIHGVEWAPLYNDWRIGVSWIGLAGLLVMELGAEVALYRSLYPVHLEELPRYWIVARWVSRGRRIRIGAMQRVALDATAVIEGKVLLVVAVAERAGVGIVSEWATLDWRTWQDRNSRVGVFVQLH